MSHSFFFFSIIKMFNPSVVQYHWLLIVVLFKMEKKKSTFVENYPTADRKTDKISVSYSTTTNCPTWPEHSWVVVASIQLFYRFKYNTSKQVTLEVNRWFKSGICKVLTLLTHSTQNHSQNYKDSRNHHLYKHNVVYTVIECYRRAHRIIWIEWKLEN